MAENDKTRSGCEKAIINNDFDKIGKWLNTLKKSIEVIDYLNCDTKKTFIKLRQIFI